MSTPRILNIMAKLVTEQPPSLGRMSTDTFEDIPLGPPQSVGTSGTRSGIASEDEAYLRGGTECHNCCGYWCQCLPCCPDWDY